MQVERQQQLAFEAPVAAAAVASVFAFGLRPSAPPDNAAAIGMPVTAWFRLAQPAMMLVLAASDGEGFLQ
jgi:hypothetical protein